MPDIYNEIVLSTVVNADGSVTYETIPRTEPWVPPPNDQQWEGPQWDAVRRDRDARLAATDWLITRSVESGLQVHPDWTAYRQALRDITLQLNPFIIEWPAEPTAPYFLPAQ